NIDGDLLERMPVADRLDKWQQDVKAGRQRLFVPPEALHDISPLPRADDRGSRDDEQHDDGKKEEDDEARRHERAPSALILIIKRSTDVTVHRWPRASGLGSVFVA